MTSRIISYATVHVLDFIAFSFQICPSERFWFAAALPNAVKRCLAQTKNHLSWIVEQNNKKVSWIEGHYVIWRKPRTAYRG